MGNMILLIFLDLLVAFDIINQGIVGEPLSDPQLAAVSRRSARGCWGISAMFPGTCAQPSSSLSMLFNMHMKLSEGLDVMTPNSFSLFN